MANNPPKAVSLDRLDGALTAWAQATGIAPSAVAPLAVAYSGGVDSTALLHRAQWLWPGAVHALHVNHGLQALAPDFEAHCVRVCAQWGIPLTRLRVDVPLRVGDSLEEQARLSRYQVLARAAQHIQAQVVCLAQHADDQAETVLLALSRGSGVAGLAAMGRHTLHGGVVFERPWLQIRRRDIDACVATLGLPAMDDPTNADTRFSRNRLRHGVLPTMERAFPSVVVALCRTARHCAQANELLMALAQEDMALVGSPPLLSALRALSDGRRANVLRAWLLSEAGRAPSTAQLDELCKQIAAATTRGHRISLRMVTGWVERRGAALGYIAQPKAVGKNHAKDGICLN